MAVLSGDQMCVLVVPSEPNDLTKVFGGFEELMIWYEGGGLLIPRHKGGQRYMRALIFNANHAAIHAPCPLGGDLDGIIAQHNLTLGQFQNVMPPQEPRNEGGFGLIENIACRS